MLSNVTHSHFYFECNKERGPIDQLYIELGFELFLEARAEILKKFRWFFGLNDDIKKSF